MALSQLPAWFCVDSEGKNVVALEVLKQRMKSHIQHRCVTLVTGDKFLGWDEQNEVP